MGVQRFYPLHTKIKRRRLFWNNITGPSLDGACIPVILERMKEEKDTIAEKLKGLKPLLSRRYGVKRIGYFGSYARGDHVAESDVDILVEFEGAVGWEFFSLESFLEQELDLKVDLVTEEALRDRLKDDILEEVVYL